MISPPPCTVSTLLLHWYDGLKFCSGSIFFVTRCAWFLQCYASERRQSLKFVLNWYKMRSWRPGRYRLNKKRCNNKHSMLWSRSQTVHLGRATQCRPESQTCGCWRGCFCTNWEEDSTIQFAVRVPQGFREEWNKSYWSDIIKKNVGLSYPQMCMLWTSF